jgi:TonB family protein
MQNVVSYFLAVNFLLILLAVYYRLFLSRQRRFTWNRIYLLAGMVAALLLPLLRLEVLPESLPDPNIVRVLPTIVIGGGGELPVAVEAPVAAVWTVWDWGFIVYCAGVLGALTLLLYRNLLVWRLIWRGKKTRANGYTLVTSAQDIGPASYFRYIFLKADDALDAQSQAVALAHERCHSRQLHSLDLLAAEVLKAFCWINPAVYFLRKYLRETHEFLADQAALQVAGVDGIKQLLLARQLGSRRLHIVHPFQSHIKQRIAMLLKNPSPGTLLRYSLLLPLAGLMVACTSLGHPLENQPESSLMIAAAVGDSQRTQAAATVGDSQRTFAPAPAPFIDLNELFVEAGLPASGASTSREGLTCLGHMPPTLDLDAVYYQKDAEAAIAAAKAYAESETMPKLLNLDRVVKLIGYPQSAKDQKIEGKVIVKVLVDETGHIARYQFLEEKHPLLRDAVEAHIHELLFKPGTKEGQPTQWWVVVPFLFDPRGGC